MTRRLNIHYPSRDSVLRGIFAIGDAILLLMDFFRLKLRVTLPDGCDGQVVLHGNLGRRVPIVCSDCFFNAVDAGNQSFTEKFELDLAMVDIVEATVDGGCTYAVEVVGHCLVGLEGLLGDVMKG